MRVRIPILLGEFILGVVAVVAMYIGYEQIATGAVVAIAATLDKVVQKVD